MRARYLISDLCTLIIKTSFDMHRHHKNEHDTVYKSVYTGSLLEASICIWSRFAWKSSAFAFKAINLSLPVRRLATFLETYLVNW